MRVYGEPAEVTKILLGMCFLESEIGQAGRDEHGTFVRAGRPDDTAIANLRAKSGIEDVRTEPGEKRQVYCHRIEH